MCAKGRVKWAYNQQPSLHERLAVRPFDERSDSGKPKGFRSSARRRVEARFAKEKQPSLHERLAVRPFDERSDSGKPKGFRSSARRRVEARFAKEKQPSLQGIYELPGRCYLP